MSGRVNFIRQDGNVHFVQTAPLLGLIVFVVCFSLTFVIALNYYGAPIWMQWVSGIGISCMGAAIVFQAWYWRKQPPILSYNILRDELSIPRRGITIPAESLSMLRIGYLTCTNLEGGQYRAATLEYHSTEMECPLVLYISAAKDFDRNWKSFCDAIKGNKRS